MHKKRVRSKPTKLTTRENIKCRSYDSLPPGRSSEAARLVGRALGVVHFLFFFFSHSPGTFSLAYMLHKTAEYANHAREIRQG